MVRARSTFRFFVAAIVAIALVFVWRPSLSSAANIGSTSCGGYPRNCVSLGAGNSHVFHYYSLTAQTAAAMDWALVNVYQPIRDLYVYWTATYGNADVIVFDLYWGDGPIGWVDCPAAASQGGVHPGHWCFGQSLYWNQTFTARPDWIDFQRHYVACHETGHTLGLRHTQWDPGYPNPTGSCMFADIAHSRVLTSHDINHINASY